MTYNEWWEPWDDPGGPEPDDEKERPDSQEDWHWDAESLAMGEYVTFPLYLSLRDRLHTLRVPAIIHNVVIKEMIDAHDDSALDGHGACSTLVYYDGTSLDIQPFAIYGGDKIKPFK